MNHSILRTLACSALLGLASVGAVQAQTANAASLPDFTGIVQKNAASVVHVEAKYTGERQATYARADDAGPGRSGCFAGRDPATPVRHADDAFAGTAEAHLARFGFHHL